MEAGADAVVHLAAETGAQRNEAKLRAANVAGLEHLIAACRACEPPPRVVFVSTVVTGDAHGALLTEDTSLPVADGLRALQAGGRADAARVCGLDVIVVRPCHVYGAGGWFAHEIVARLRQPGRLAIVGRGDNAWDMVHVDDLAGALALAVESGRPGEIYHCADDVPTTYAEAVGRTATALGVGAPHRVPAAVARLDRWRGPGHHASRARRARRTRS